MRNSHRVRIGFLLLFSGLSMKSVLAQDQGSLVLQGGVGGREYIIESACGGGPQKSFGGSVHYYMTRRTSIGPEVLWYNHCNQVFTYYAPHLSATLQIDHSFGVGRVQPYVIGSLGLVSHNSRLAPPQIKLEAAAGGGAKVFFAKRVFFAPEASMGADATIRYRFNLGFVLR